MGPGYIYGDGWNATLLGFYKTHLLETLPIVFWPIMINQ